MTVLEDAPTAGQAPAPETVPQVDFDTDPAQYRHWRFEVDGETAWVYLDVAEDGGLVEFLADLGDSVAAGDPVARLWPLGRTGVAPSELTAARAGVLCARHVPGIVKPGDCVAVVGVEIEA